MKTQNQIDAEKRHIEARKRLNKRTRFNRDKDFTDYVIPITTSHIGLSKRAERYLTPASRFDISRPALKDYLADMQESYEKEHGKKAGSSVIKFWKRAYRDMYNVKDSGKPVHNLTRIKAFRIMPNKLHKPVKKSESLGAGMDMEKFQHKYMEKWRQES